MRHQTSRLLIIAMLTLMTACAFSPQTEFQPAVATSHPLATQAGLAVLATGGNAFDAAVASAAVLGVVEPYKAGLGGGSFWLLQDANGKTRFVDARETAPRQIHPNHQSNPQDQAQDGPLAAAIPGQAAALVHVSKQYGRIPLLQALLSAATLAREGFRINEDYRQEANKRYNALTRYPASAGVFLVGQRIPPTGALIRQQALADTLTALGRFGTDGFYRGPVASKLVADVQSAGGDWTLADLAAYRVVDRAPLRISIGRDTLWMAPPPSSGGIALAEMFGMMNARSFDELDTHKIVDQAARVHYQSELMRLTAQDQRSLFGDPDFSDLPTQRLLNQGYLANRAQNISMAWASPNQDVTDADGTLAGGAAQIAVLDRDGNRVSATFSINQPFGSGFVSAQTGILLNNAMLDFSQAAANRPEPGKRPLSSMTPLLLNGPKQSAILSTSGDQRIVSITFQNLLDLMAGEEPDELLNKPRFHPQFQPDEIQYEPAFYTPDLAKALETLGHTLKRVNEPFGNMQLIQINHWHEKTRAASDPRGSGEANVIRSAKH